MFSLRDCVGWLRLVLLGVMLCVPGLVGCSGGSKKGIVSGKVTYKGEPLGNGTVVFIGADNKGGSSQIGADGAYKVSDAPVGPVKITVETVPTAGASKPIAMPGVTDKDKSALPSMPGQENKAGKYVKIPDKYKDASKSGLTYEVKSGSQTFDINLSD